MTLPLAGTYGLASDGQFASASTLFPHDDALCHLEAPDAMLAVSLPIIAIRCRRPAAQIGLI